jgi:mannose-6-phosphate isomerase-like protein (cupin superfamily)
MPRKQLGFRKSFTLALRNARAQAATMVIAPGNAEGGPNNRHRGSDQWLYVLSGTGRATINGRGQGLRAGTLLLIERGSTHEIRNTGRISLKTLNLYVPPLPRQAIRSHQGGRPVVRRCRPAGGDRALAVMGSGAR